MSRRIDAHHHVWRLERGDYDWLTAEDYPTLLRDFEAVELKTELDRHDVQDSVLIQAAETVAETRYMLRVAAETPFIKAVVGWVDMERDDAPEVLAELASDSHFRGIRPSLMSIEDSRWILGANQQRTLAALAELELTFDALVWPSQLETLHEALLRHPDLGCVINHFGYPDFASADLGGWKRAMARLAADTNAHVKFSGILMGLGDLRGDDDFRPACDHLQECFGARRIMWGSDWPHLLADSDYRSWHRRSVRLLERLNPQELQDVFGGTAARFYRI